MAVKIDFQLTPKHLVPQIERLFELSGQKIRSIEATWKPENGTPVYTVQGQYTTRGWTEWTQGFQFGSAVLQYDATGEREFLEIGRRKTLEVMASHISHIGVHDHGFNNVSTYGNLLRLLREGKIEANEWEGNFYELALKISGAIQSARWTPIANGEGFIHSFNGPHSLFIDTIRSLRSLAVSYLLGHELVAEHDERICPLRRLIEHARTTARYGVYYGEGRDAYDIRGRTAHESIFNVHDGYYRCPSTQQGYSPFSTWTRGLSWAVCGYPEELEFLETISDEALEPYGGRESVVAWMLEAARATADFFLEHACTDGVPAWDTGAPGLTQLGDYLTRPSDPYNEWEPMDGSASAIAAQGLVRLGNFLIGRGEKEDGNRYRQAGLTMARTLFDDPYLSTDPNHQGLLLHTNYHRPNGWDHIPSGQKIPNGESAMWGDYHARELALMILREVRSEPYLTFFAGVTPRRG